MIEIKEASRVLCRKLLPVIFLLVGTVPIANADPIQMIDFDRIASASTATTGYVQLINFNTRPPQHSGEDLPSLASPRTPLKLTRVSSKITPKQGFRDAFSYLNPDAHLQSETLLDASAPLPAEPRAAARKTALRFTGDARLERAAITEYEFADLFVALVQAESNFDHRMISNMGAIGLAQLMPATAEALGVDPYSVEQNLYGGAEYLLQQIENFNSIEFALAAYNAGPNAVARYGAIPPFPETEAYVARIKSYGAEGLIETVRQRRSTTARARNALLMSGTLSPPPQPFIIHDKEG